MCRYNKETIMMYNNKFVACIKVAGKILHDSKETVRIPFGSEYSILLKNLNNVKASIKISIDGKDALNGSLIINGNSEINLERFIKNGNFDSGNRFKFIERNSKVEQTRGIQAEDGLIRVEFQFEKVIQPSPNYYPKWAYPDEFYKGGQHYGSTEIYRNYDVQSSTLLRSTYNGVGMAASAAAAPSGETYSANVTSGAAPTLNDRINTRGLTKSATKGTVVNDAGITAPGSVSNQKFVAASSFSLESEKHLIIFKLVGETEEGIQFVKPVTVDTRQKCVTCSTINKIGHKFCKECGTGLVIV